MSNWDDKTWEKLRRANLFDLWTTRLAWTIAIGFAGASCWKMVTGDKAAAIVAFACAAACVAVACWVPSLIKIEDEP